MSFITTAESRKSVRSFLNKPVPRELIEKVIRAATYAPTNCNQQLWNFTVIEEAATKERLIAEAASSTLIRRAPVVVVVSYDGWNYKEAIQGGALAAGHILLAATELGLGSLPMNSYGADSHIKRVLNLPENQTICCFVLLGFSDERAQAAPQVPRRNVKEVIHWGTFNSVRSQIPFLYDPEAWTFDDLVNHQRFYCRKTVLGKEMDIMSGLERDLVRRELATIPSGGRVQDILSYDGAYLREFPQGTDIVTFDLCKETAEYTRAAAGMANIKIEAEVLSKEPRASQKASQNIVASTSLFRFERIPTEVRKLVYQQASGELIIIARKRNLFLSLFFLMIKVLFGKDIRRTGIFNFFGPYKPISVGTIVHELEQAGFANIQWRGYFFVPAFFEQIYQMFLQYQASEGSSYLHRERRTTPITKFIAWSLRVQGLKSFGPLGSVAVIRCRK